MKLIKQLVVAGLFAASLSTFAQIDPNRTVVVINGEEIKGGEYYRRMEYLPGVGRQSGNAFAEFPPGFLTIDQLISERLVFQLAKDKGVYPSDSEVDAEVSIRVSEYPDLLQNWIASGRTAQELAYQVRYDMAQFRVATFGITITDQEIEKEYAGNSTQYTIPKQYKLRVIVVHERAQQDAVDKDLAAGKSFAEIATSRSEDISHLRGGEFGPVPIDALSPVVKTELGSITIGKTTQWMESTVGTDSKQYSKFLLENVIEAQKLPLDGKLKRRIRQTMMSTRGSVKNNVQKEMLQMRAKAKIDIKQPEFAEAYKHYIEAYLKQGG